MIGTRALAAVAALALMLAGCAGPVGPGSVIDGYKIGDPNDCTFAADPVCDDAFIVAIDTATGKRGVDPNVIGDHRFFSEYIPPGYVLSGSTFIVVFDLVDGSQMAVGVYCGAGPCQAVSR